MNDILSTSSSVKIAPTQYPVIEPIKARWSARSFEPRPIAEDDLMALFEAAAWAPSSVNEQPWRFAYAHRGESAFSQFASCLSGGNLAWAGGAAVLVAVVAKSRMSANDHLNMYALHDTGMATANLFIQATAMGIQGHIMGGFDRAKARALFNIPEGYEPVTFLALGYPGDPDALEEPFHTRELTPRTRRSLDQTAFHGQFEW